MLEIDFIIGVEEGLAASAFLKSVVAPKSFGSFDGTAVLVVREDVCQPFIVVNRTQQPIKLPEFKLPESVGDFREAWAQEMFECKLTQFGYRVSDEPWFRAESKTLEEARTQVEGGNDVRR